MTKKQKKSKNTTKPIKKVTKKPVKSVVKKSKNKKVNTTKVADFLTKKEILQYKKMLEKSIRSLPSNTIPAPGDLTPEEVKHRELQLLGDKYDEIVNALPTEADKAKPDTDLNAPCADISHILKPRYQEFGAVTEIAELCGIPYDAFQKFMRFMLGIRLIKAGDIAHYNIYLKEFVTDMKNKKAKEKAKEEELSEVSESSSIVDLGEGPHGH
jgi:hypothetical protein